MNINLPPAPERYSTAFFNNFFQILSRVFNQIVAKDGETPRIILRSPNGTNYDVTVSDAGVLVVTATEKTRA
jgi:hypothetical protein